MIPPNASFPSASIRILMAAFMAVLFALLLLLPASGQSTFDRTDGRISSGGLSVGVFDDIEDAQLIKNTSSPYTDPEGQTTTVFLPITNPSAHLETQGAVEAGDTAYLANGQVSPQQTFFGDTLWASNDPDAYNTILITAESDLVTPTAEGCAVATVRGGRASTPISVQMALTADTGGTTYYQAFLRILDPQTEDENGDLVYTLSSDGPSCTAYATGVSQDATAFILARHGDRIAINVPGAGEVSVEVDGEGPDLLDIRPEDLSHLPSRSLDFSFTVRDNEAGLRHDGELVVTADGDYTEVNGDGDHVTSGEPLSVFSGGQITLNGDAAEIDLEVWDRDADVNTARDITGAGAWTLLGNRPGVAYSFLAETNDYAEGAYFMEITAYDRAGNKTVSDALDKVGADTYLFTVDDTDPAHIEAWTGIAYELNELGGLEVTDRSWIMVELTEAVRRGVNPEYIRVAGHDVVSVFQPDEAPDPDRDVTGRNDDSLIGAQRQTFAPPAPRAAASLAPAMQNTCGSGNAGSAITGFRFAYDRTTGDMTVLWDRHGEDSEGYRLGMVLGGTALAVIDLAAGSCSYSIPRASGVGRAIEAAFGGGGRPVHAGRGPARRRICARQLTGGSSGRYGLLHRPGRPGNCIRYCGCAVRAAPGHSAGPGFAVSSGD